MWKKSILASLLIGAVSLCIFAGDTAEPEIVYRPADEVFEDEVTGLKFSSRVAAYRKFAVSCNVNPEFGNVVRYRGGAACGDVYIYSLNSKGDPVTQDALVKEFADVVKSIRTMPERSSMVKSVAVVEMADLKLPPGVLCRSFRIQTDREEIKSLLVMLLYKGKIIKIRVSFPVDAPTEERNAILFSREILVLTGRKEAAF